MSYHKPELIVLRLPLDVILSGSSNKGHCLNDNLSEPATNTAYEADE